MICTCCGTTYARGRWTCCAPRPGQTFAHWLEEFCAEEDGRDELRRRCPRHCQCVLHVARRAREKAPAPKAAVVSLLRRTTAERTAVDWKQIAAGNDA